VPSVNYGGFIDNSDTKQDYIEIDNEIINFCKDLFFDIPNTEKVRDFLLSPHDA
jgi:hypothetical protein